MSLFFAHHAPSGTMITEEKNEEKSSQSDPPKKIKVTPDSVTNHLKDIGVYDKMQKDLKGLMDSKKEAVKKFFDAENPVKKIESASKLLKAKSPEDLVKIAKTIEDKDMAAAVDEYIKKFNDAAQKIANDKSFQESFVKNQKSQVSEADDQKVKGPGQNSLDKDALKKEAIRQVFAKAQPEFNKAMQESLGEYSTWIFESVESIYKIPEKALKNPIVKKSVEEKDAALMKIISNISS